MNSSGSYQSNESEKLGACCSIKRKELPKEFGNLQNANKVGWIFQNLTNKYVNMSLTILTPSFYQAEATFAGRQAWLELGCDACGGSLLRG